MSIVFRITMASALLFSTSANAQEEPANLAACHALDRDQQRLDCYDRLSNYTTEEAPIFESQVRWTLLENTDPITGEDTSRAYLDASDMRNGPASPEFMMLECDGEGGYVLYIGTMGYIGSSGNRVSVTYRWDDNEPITDRWNGSISGKAAFLPNSYRDFIAGLREGGELAFQWVDFRGGRYASVWNNVRLDENAEFILNGCQLEGE